MKGGGRPRSKGREDGAPESSARPEKMTGVRGRLRRAHAAPTRGGADGRSHPWEPTTTRPPDMKREAEGAPARGHRDTDSHVGCGTAHANTYAVSAADKSVAFEARRTSGWVAAGATKASGKKFLLVRIQLHSSPIDYLMRSASSPNQTCFAGLAAFMCRLVESPARG